MFKKLLLIALLTGSGISVGALGEDATYPMSVSIEGVAFTPKDSILNLLAKEISEAKHEISVMVFIFDWKPLADLLIDAKKRGVKVRVLTDDRSLLPMDGADGTRMRESALSYMERNGIEVIVYRHPSNSIMHNKVVLIDNDASFIGSFNFQHQAENTNFENFILIRSEPFQAVLRDEFDRISAVSLRAPEKMDEPAASSASPWRLSKKRMIFATSLLANLGLLIALIRKTRTSSP